MAWKYGLQMRGDASVMRSTDSGHRNITVMMEYQVRSLTLLVELRPRSRNTYHVPVLKSHMKKLLRGFSLRARGGPECPLTPLKFSTGFPFVSPAISANYFPSVCEDLPSQGLNLMVEGRSLVNTCVYERWLAAATNRIEEDGLEACQRVR